MTVTTTQQPAAPPATGTTTAPTTPGGPARRPPPPPPPPPPLGVAYGRRPGRAAVQVLTGVDLEARAGEVLGIIGESGSGKTTLARAVVGLAPAVAGRITLDGRDVTALRGRALRELRRSGVVQYMFQDPLRSLDPDLTVSQLIGEPLAVAGVARPAREPRVLAALEQVGLDATLADRTPGRLSGGQRQRVSLARAVVTRPRLLLADEPVSALDASNRNHVLRLLDRLRHELDLAVVVISHDLGSLAGIADRIAVLYGGRLVEQGPAEQVLERPLHPYTALLAGSAPGLPRERRSAAALLRGSGPVDDPLLHTGAACVFAHRCPFADDDCRSRPEPRQQGDGRTVACHRAPAWRERLAH
ncbi:hypothetical protein GCM10009665_73070 [Kitasatospora nipponensis]|uniref:ABC transporter domain-containing protein n=1 Tax=Kitasatospora nipponensis TaxID=258049 RepID=A0ABN1X089_9ACTN